MSFGGKKLCMHAVPDFANHQLRTCARTATRHACVCAYTPRANNRKNLAASEIFLQHFDACARVTLSLNNFAQQWESPSKQGVLTASAALGDPGPHLAL